MSKNIESNKENEIVLFETEDQTVTLSVPVDGDTVWLTRLLRAALKQE